MNDEFPVLPFRSTTYTPAELFDGFDPDDPHSYARTPDFAAYRSTHLPPSRDVGMLRALHDQCMNDARDVVLDGHRVVAIMGGHEMGRDEPAYALVARIAADLTRRHRLMVSGGGPGAMEATHLGALLARHGDALDGALAELAEVPAFPETADLVGPRGGLDEEVLAQLHAWQVPAFRVAAQVARGDRGVSLAIPTWFYGHEPPTPFATHLAKYFSNPIREDGLLSVARAGIVFAPGRAGTIQEIFQDATQNYYRAWGQPFSPMAFLDLDGWWSRRYPVGPVLEALFGADAYRTNVLVTPDPDEIIEFLARHDPGRA